MLLGIDFLQNIQLQNLSLFFLHLLFISQTTHLPWETSLLRLFQRKLLTLNIHGLSLVRPWPRFSLPCLLELGFRNTLVISFLRSRLSSLSLIPRLPENFLNKNMKPAVLLLYPLSHSPLVKRFKQNIKNCSNLDFKICRESKEINGCPGRGEGQGLTVNVHEGFYQW